jgi:hypothetical protein
MTQKKKSMGEGGRRGARSTLDDQFVILDDRVAQKIAANVVQLGLGLGAVELELDELANAGGFDRREAMVMDGIAHRNSLRIEDTLFRQHDDFGFHKEGHPMKHEAMCQRDFCDVTHAILEEQEFRVRRRPPHGLYVAVNSFAENSAPMLPCAKLSGDNRSVL